MTVTIGNDHIFEWVQLLVSSVITLVAVFLGAGLAFKVENIRENERTRAKNIAAVNWMIFSLGQTVSRLVNIRDQIINPVRNCAMRFLEMRPVLEGQAEYSAVSLNDLSFLLETNNRNLLMELHVEIERAITIFALLKQRSRSHVLELQPKMEAAGFVHGTSVLAEETAKAIGNRLLVTLEQLTNQIIIDVDATIASHQSIMEKLVKAAKELYPEANFIKIDFIKN